MKYRKLFADAVTCLLDVSMALLVKNNYLEILMLTQTECTMKTVALNFTPKSDKSISK